MIDWISTTRLRRVAIVGACVLPWSLGCAVPRPPVRSNGQELAAQATDYRAAAANDRPPRSGDAGTLARDGTTGDGNRSGPDAIARSVAMIPDPPSTSIYGTPPIDADRRTIQPVAYQQSAQRSSAPVVQAVPDTQGNSTVLSDLPMLPKDFQTRGSEFNIAPSVSQDFPFHGAQLGTQRPKTATQRMLELASENKQLLENKSRLEASIRMLNQQLDSAQMELDRQRSEEARLRQQLSDVQQENRLWRSKLDELAQYFQSSRAQQSQRIRELTETIDQLQMLIETSNRNQPNKPKQQVTETTLSDQVDLSAPKDHQYP